MMTFWRLFSITFTLTAIFLCSNARSALRDQCNDIDKLTLSQVSADLSHKYTTDSQGPSPLKVCLVTFLTEDIWDYAKYAILINGFYARVHEYPFEVVYPGHRYSTDMDNYDHRWNKVKLLHDAISPQGWAADICDYVLWLDADFIVLNMNVSWSELIVQSPQAHVFASSEYAGSTTLINSGSVLVRNSHWSRQFLQQWWSLADRRLYSDQEQFDMLCHTRAQTEGASFWQKIAILPPAAMNSDPPAMTKLREHHSFLHLMGEETAYRRAVFAQAFQHLCSVAESAPQPATSVSSLLPWIHPQLTLNQSYLLTTAIFTYFEESQRLLPQLLSPPSSHLPHSLSFCRLVANVVHHLVHALEHLSVDDLAIHQTMLTEELAILPAAIFSLSREQWKTEVARHGQHLRIQVYQGMQRNVQHWQQLLHNHTDPHKPSWLHADYPEMLKTCAIAGQHLLPSVMSLSLSMTQRLQVAAEMEQLLETMFQVADPGQQPAILHMAVHHLMQEGHLTLEVQQLDTALQRFERAVELAGNLIPSSGHHHVITPLMLTANVLTSLGRHTEAAQRYEQAEQALQVAMQTTGRQQTWMLHLQLMYNRVLSLSEASAETADQERVQQSWYSVLIEVDQVLLDAELVKDMTTEEREEVLRIRNQAVAFLAK